MALQNSLNIPLPSTDGQLLIGNTGNLPLVNTLTGGNGINIDNSVPGNITINNAGPYTVPTWERVFTDTHMEGNHGYYSGLVSGNPITFYLPNIPNSGMPPYKKVGDIYSVMNQEGSDVSIKCNPNQSIYYTTAVTSSSSIFTNIVGACITLYCFNSAIGSSLFLVLSTNGLAFTVP